MHEDKFAKQVSEKLDQLGFDPSDSVWAGVDRELNNDKKKRRPLFWIFLFSGLVLAGGTLYIVKQQTTSGNLSAIPSTQAAVQSKPDTTANRIGKNLQFSQGILSPEGKLGADSKRRAGSKGFVVLGKPGHFNQHGQVRESATTSATQAASPGAVESQTENAEKKQIAVAKGEEPASKAKDSLSLVNVQGTKSNQPLAKDSVSSLKTVQKNKQPQKSSPWSLAYTASLGVSTVQQSTLSSTYAGASYYPSNSNTVTAGPSISPTSNSGQVHPGFSFGLDVLVNRRLSKRISLSAGLGYHYFSTKINTGTLVDSGFTFYAGSGQYSSVRSFYLNGQVVEHTNQYHFIELPVNLNLQLNRSIKTPIVWQAGFSVAWMVASNALLFNPYDNVYFVDKQAFNPIQWNAATAVLVGIPLQSHSFQLGPQVQYGITGLAKTNAGNPGHLFFVGLKMSFIP